MIAPEKPPFSIAYSTRVTGRSPRMLKLGPLLYSAVRTLTAEPWVARAGGGGSGGMTAKAVCALSLDPLLALVCFANEARTLPIVREAGRFGVNVLTAEQEQLAGVFASKLPEAEKLDTVDHHLEEGIPIIDGVLAWATCQLRELIPGGDHTIAIGEVTSMGLGGGRPLVWYAGRYHDWGT